MKKLFLNNILYIIAAVVLIITTYLLSKEKVTQRRQIVQESVGSISPLGQDVRWKSAQDPLWSEVSGQKSVFSRDKVFTGANSRALVKLKDSSEFTVQPNSLIEIVFEEKSPLLTLEEGSVRGEMNSKQPLAIKVKGRRFNLAAQDANVEVSTMGEEVQVVVDKGEVELVDTSTGEIQVVTIEKPVVFEAQEEIKKEKFIEPLTEVAELPTEPIPSEQKEIAQPHEIVLPSQFLRPVYAIEWTHSQFASVPVVEGFSREPNVVVPLQLNFKNGEHTLELSESNTFDQSEKFNIDKSVWSWEQPRAGLFYMRLITKHNNKTVYSETSTLQVVLSAPKGEVKALNDKYTPFSKVAWKAQQHPSAKKIEMEYSHTWDFKESVKKISTDLTGEIHVPSAGRYHFRFRSLNNNGWPLSAYSHTSVLYVDPTKPARKQKSEPEVPVRVLAMERAAPVEEIIKKTEMKVEKEALAPKRKKKATLGGGVAQYSLKQADNMDIESAQLSGALPLMTVGFGMEIDESSFLEVSYTTASSNMEVNEGGVNSTSQFKLEMLSLNYQRRLAAERFKSFTLLGGYSLRRIPLLQASSVGNLSVGKASLHLLTLGFDYNWSLFSNWETTVGGRAHYAASASASQIAGFELDPSMQWELILSGRRRVFSQFYLIPRFSYRLQDFSYSFEQGGTGSQDSSEFSLNLLLQYEF